jgi:hypothetical protein
MGFRKLLLGGLLAMLGQASAHDVRSDELEPSEPPRRPFRAVPATERGHRIEGPGFVTWQESAREAESWAHALAGSGTIATACGLCGRILGPDGVWRAAFGARLEPSELSHGFCPTCAREHHPDLFDDL